VALTAQVFASTADWAGAISAVVAVIGVLLVVLQLRSATAASRAQATIQFQRAFLRSRDSRYRLLRTFPIHADTLERLAPAEERGRFRTWERLEELTEDDVRDARAVVNAMNDVAQYVSDGLALRSALQQYHTIFVRAGALVLPYLEAVGTPQAGNPQARYGRRVVDLYNAGISYHHSHPKHRGRELALERPAIDGSGEVRLVLLDAGGEGVEEHTGFADESRTTPATLAKRLSLRLTVRRAERSLRR
jgi:hypothetical protein